MVERGDEAEFRMARVEEGKILEVGVLVAVLESKTPVEEEGRKVVGTLARRSISVMVTVEHMWAVAYRLHWSSVRGLESSWVVLDMTAKRLAEAVAAQAPVWGHLDIPPEVHILLLVVKLALMAPVALSHCQQVDVMAAEVQRTAAPVRHLGLFAQQPLSAILIESVAM